MLTVRYDWLGVRAGDRLLDLGAGFGRHATAAARRGAVVTAVDLADNELKETRALLREMIAAGEVPASTDGGVVSADGTRLPFADGVFDRVIAAEVLEHVPDDAGALAELARVLRPGGTIAVTVPAYLPEVVCWLLSDDYHAPKVKGGHVRIYREPELRERLRAAGLRPGNAHHAHALHTPYWWIRCAVGPRNETHPLVSAYRRLLEWDIVEAPALTRVADRLLNPVLGKSLVVYATKPQGATA